MMALRVRDQSNRRRKWFACAKHINAFPDFEVMGLAIDDQSPAVIAMMFCSRCGVDEGPFEGVDGERLCPRCLRGQAE